MKPLGSSLFECVYLAGHPALTTSNSNEPPGSFHSKDVFTPHPSIPNRWKYASRLDDRITLVNGEKVLPLPIEGYIKQDPLIHEAVVVGLGKAAPGLLIFKAAEAEDLSTEEYLETIWPTIEGANARAERFSQIPRDLIVVLSHTSKFPRTDKGSMIRAQVYLQYAGVIDGIYTSAERVEGSLQLDLPETQSVLMGLCRNELGISLSSAKADFFAEGVDSLKAIHLRRLVLQNFQFDNDGVGQNVVYETGSIARLAEHICALQSGKSTSVIENDAEAMLDLIHRYSSFQEHIPQSSTNSTTKSVVSLPLLPNVAQH